MRPLLILPCESWRAPDKRNPEHDECGEAAVVDKEPDDLTQHGSDPSHAASPIDPVREVARRRHSGTMTRAISR